MRRNNKQPLKWFKFNDDDDLWNHSRRKGVGILIRDNTAKFCTMR